MQKTINKNKVHDISTSLVDIKKNNPDFQIPMIYDGPFKTVCKTFPEFINTIIVNLLGIDPNDIEKAYFVDTELPIEQHSNKKMIVDLLLHVADDSLINIEAYTNLTPENILKNNQYAYRIILKDQVNGEGYKKLNFVQLVFVKNKIKLFKDKLVSVFTTREEETNEVLPYTPKLIYVSLANVEEIAYNEDKKWLYHALKLLTSDSIEESRQLVGNSPILSKVVNFMEDYSSEINNLIYVDRDIEDAKWEKIGREIAKNEGYNDGKSDGLIEGQVAGEQKKQQEIIKTALQRNLDVETIADITKLSVDEVLKIKESLE